MALHEKGEHSPEETEDYFANQADGAGLENFSPDTLSTAYLGMVQPGSGPTLKGHQPGTWRNSANDANYGPEVEVVALAFKTVWTERSKDPPYNTVGRYEPDSIPVDIEKPKPGTRGFPKMTNPQTGNKVEELFIYAVMLKDHPEEGVLYLSPTVKSMSALKRWNSAMRAQRRPNGKLAQIYSYSWRLKLEMIQNPAKPAEKLAVFAGAERGEYLGSYQDLVKQITSSVSVANEGNIALLAAPEASGEVDEPQHS